jgi:hypothetical protein
MGVTYGSSVGTVYTVGQSPCFFVLVRLPRLNGVAGALDRVHDGLHRAENGWVR